jgi:hypothetical protein
MPSFRLVAKEKQADGRYRKVYEKEPVTPYELLPASSDVSEESKAELRQGRAGQNPVELNRRLNDTVGQLLKLNREKRYGEKTPCQGDGRAPRGLISTRFLFLGNRHFSTRKIIRQCAVLTIAGNFMLSYIYAEILFAVEFNTPPQTSLRACGGSNQARQTKNGDKPRKNCSKPRN